MKNLSVYDNSLKSSCNRPIDSIILDITLGKYHDEVQALTDLIAEGKHTEAEDFKNNMPGFTPSGTFGNDRTPAQLKQYSQFIYLGIEDLSKDELDRVFRQAIALETTYCCFRGGDGASLKIFVQVTSEGDYHERAFKQVADHYLQLLNIPVDHSYSDITILCPYSFDPEIFSNIESQPFQVIENPEAPQSDHELHIAIPDEDYLEMYQFTVCCTEKSNPEITRDQLKFVQNLAINCNKAGIPEYVACKLIVEDFSALNDDDISTAIENAYNNKAEFGTIGRLARDILMKKETNDVKNDEMRNTPIIPDTAYQNLPALLKGPSEQFQNRREKDVFLTGALTILSGCLNEVSGTYDQRTVYPNLFSFVIAPPASGKGSLGFAKELAMTYHRKVLKNSEERARQYKALTNQNSKADKEGKKKNEIVNKSSSPKKPSFKVVYIPANSSSAAVINHLQQSGGIGIICETEADTMSNSLKQDWGGYSDLLRKAFHHEPVTYSRKANDEFFEVETPRISVALSGTPNQVKELIKSAEDGLFSRFIFYSYSIQPQWRDVSTNDKPNLTEYFKTVSVEVEKMIYYLQCNPTHFDFTPNQWGILNRKFGFWLHEVSHFVSENVGSSVKRLGLIFFRMAMVLSAIKKFEDGFSNKDITCTDEDFEVALALVEVYKQHALFMFKNLPNNSKPENLDQSKKDFYQALPEDRDFTRQEAVQIGKTVSVQERTVGKYLKLFLGELLEQPVKYGPYRKIA